MKIPRAGKSLAVGVIVTASALLGAILMFTLSQPSRADIVAYSVWSVVCVAGVVAIAHDWKEGKDKS